MKLRCMINGVEYDIIQGATFSEEYNETLDSGTIILDHVKKIKDLKPYDDVFIYSNPGSFRGYPVQQRIVGDNLQDKYILTALPSLISADGDMRFILGKSFYNFMHKQDIVGNVNLKFNFNMQSVSAENLRIDSEDIDDDDQDEDVLKGKIQNPNDFGVYTTFSISLFNGAIAVATINFNKEIAAFGSFNLENEVDISSYTGNFNRIEILSATYPKNGSSFGEYDTNKIIQWDRQNLNSNSNINIDSIEKQYNCTVSIQLIIGTSYLVINKNGTGGDSNNLYIYLCEKTFNNNNQFIINYSNYELNKIVYADFPYSFNLIDPKLNVNISYTYENLSNINEPYFYKHLLVDQFTEEMINVDEDFDDQNFKYTIQLFSETKKLETIQLPNISVTQPLNYNKKRSIWDYLGSFVDMYSPLIKVETGESWTYEKKYTVSPSLQAIFGDTFSPDFVMNTPNLRDLLAKLMIVKDRIPYVKDDVIYAMDITARNGEFNANGVNFITGTMTSDTYCDNLKRNYTEALSQDNSARLVEYLGFRNSGVSLMNLSNMRLETRFPIYKINKMYMCYYKKIDVILDNDTSNVQHLAFLCKQDISPLVKLNSERNLLSENWERFNQVSPFDIESLSKFKMATVGYDIGSKNIIGWGEQYKYPVIISFWDTTKTYVENIQEIVDRQSFGLNNYSDIINLIREKYPDAQDIKIKTYSRNAEPFGISNIVSPFGANTYPEKLSNYIPDALPLKSLFFQVDYNAFYSGAVIQSKDDSRDDIVIGDNQSSSLTLLEQDGIAQKEKANRFANKTLRLNARYDGDYNNLQALGSVFSNKSYDDIVIYHREYSIWDNMISAVYYGSKDYVLKNYFTSVFARYRTYNLMSYGESTNRAENKRMLLCFSKDNYQLELENKQFALTNFDNFYSKVLSAFKQIESPYYTGDKINYGYIKFNTTENNLTVTKYYGSDINIFNSGLALCFNIKMFDNVSSGVFIERPNPAFKAENVDEERTWGNWWTDLLQLLNGQEASNQIAGSAQKWLLTVDDEETGFAENMGFYICHINSDNYFANNKIVNKTDVFDISSVPLDYEKGYYSRILKLPEIEINELNRINILGNDYQIIKDNKECIDMTFEIEAYSNDKNVIISPLLLQLSDLLSNYKRFAEDVSYTYAESVDDGESEYFTGGVNIKYYSSTIGQMYKQYKITSTYPYFEYKFYGYTTPLMILEISSDSIQNLLNNLPISTQCDFIYENFNLNGSGQKSPKGYKTFYEKTNQYSRNFLDTTNETYDVKGNIVYYSFITEKITKIEQINGIYYMELQGLETVTYSTGGVFNANTESFTNLNKIMRFKAVNNLEDFNITGTHPETGNLWFVNLEKISRPVVIQTPEAQTVNIESISMLEGNEIKYSNGGIIPFYNYKFTNGSNDIMDSVFYKGNEAYYEGNYNDLLSYNTISSKDEKQTTLIYDGSTITFPQNMFIVYSENTIDKTNMYDQFSDLSYVDGYISTETTHSFEDVFSINDSDVPYIGVNLAYLPSTANSVQYWYYDTSELDSNGNLMSPLSHSNSYRFVFGINVTDADRNVGEIKVYLSLTSTKDARIYDIMHNVIGKNHNYYYNKNDKVYGVQQYFDSINDYFVKFEPNYPEMGHPSEVRVMEAQTFTKGVQQALSTCAFVRPYYRFVGWSKKASPEEGDAIDFKDGETVMFNEDVTLYAIWELIE